MKTRKFKIGEISGLANILLSITMILLIMRYSWERSKYVCNLTGCQKIIDRVFGVPVHTKIIDTDASRWLDARLGSSQNHHWQRIGFQTMIGGPVCACKPIPFYVYQLYQMESYGNDKYRNEILEELQKARQTINKNTRDAESETQD